ncbi:MAG: glycosyltransferase family 2 protein, partial [Chloroflexi bacterium]|nr:glycosyltransferase family 2 protein [Chloroflexota bacterium]
AGFETIRHWSEILWPFDTPVLRSLFNRVLAHVWPFRHLNLTNFILARPKSFGLTQRELPSVSVIVPARNEAGNIAQIFDRVPRLGRETELVFVEGHSRDSTYAAIEQAIAAHPDWKCQLWRQTGVGKGDAVRLGFTQATGEILMILDADLTMPPEDLPRYYQVLRSGLGEFANGVRLIYPMEGEAMRFLNLVGNRFFSAAFSWLLGQPVKDTLCGTKALWKRDYDLIAANRAAFGDFDPFGDFDLLFGAAKLNLKITDLPIRYRERTYGATNINRWKHGWLLLKMVWFALWRLKFV